MCCAAGRLLGDRCLRRAQDREPKLLGCRGNRDALVQLHTGKAIDRILRGIVQRAQFRFHVVRRQIEGERRPLLLVVLARFATGQIELLGLNWSDMDAEDGMVHVARSLQYQRGSGPAFVSPKTSRSRRPIKLGQRALEALKPHLKAQLLQRMKIGPFWQD